MFLSLFFIIIITNIVIIVVVITIVIVVVVLSEMFSGEFSPRTEALLGAVCVCVFFVLARPIS